METHDQARQLNAIVDRLLGREPPRRRSIMVLFPPFDISKPNIHDSKKEFLVEFVVVQRICTRLHKIVLEFSSKVPPKPHGHKAMVDRLVVAIDAGALQQNQNSRLDTPTDLAIRNIFDTGFFHGSLRIVWEMFTIYNERLVELKDQEKQFWSVSNRAPNYFARTIAVRLARLYAKEKGQRPTFGISREGNFPSTDFGRALEDVFGVLGIKASVRPAAEWAINELTDDDLSPPQNVMGGLFGLEITQPD